MNQVNPGDRSDKRVDKPNSVFTRVWNFDRSRSLFADFAGQLFNNPAQKATTGLLFVLCWTSAIFIAIALIATILLFGHATPSKYYLLGMVLVTSVIPLLNHFVKKPHFWSWFLCIFLIFSSSYMGVLTGTVVTPASVFLLIPIFWSLLLLRSRASILITGVVIVCLISVTLTGIAQKGDGFGVAEHGNEYIWCCVLVLSAMTFALVGWLISEGAAASRQKLIAARDEAQKANREKSELIASITHEIRTPLTGLMGMLELLTREPLAQGQKEMADTARASSRDILNLINDLLDMSKMEIGELRLIPEPVNVVSLFEQTTREFQAAAVEKNLDLKIEAPAEPTWLLLDPLRFRQVLSNYLSNALKFTDTGSIEARLVCEPTNENDISLQLEVSDTGPGIPAHLVSRIFGRFFQVAQTQKAQYAGTGIGLAVVSDLAKLQGGRVWVDSAVGSGSTFYFACPYKRTSAMETPQLSTLSDKAENATLTVLIADDSIGTQRVLTRVLRGLGYQTISVEDGNAAVLAITKHTIDAVLMDLHMPLKDGLTALKEIRQLPSPVCNTPVIGLSAEDSPAELGRWKQADVDAFASKPVDFAKLDLAIRRVVGNRTATPEKRARPSLKPDDTPDTANA